MSRSGSIITGVNGARPIVLGVGLAGLFCGLLGLSLFSAGCRSLPKGYETPPEIDVSWESPEVSTEPIENTVMLFQAALTNSRRIRTLQREVDLARAKTHNLGSIRDPELRMGYEWGNGDGDGSSSQTSSQQSWSDQTGSATTWDEVVPRAERSTQTESESSRSSQQSRRTRNEWENMDQYGWALGIRLFPPNPWEYASEVSQTEAEWHLAESELREEQLDVLGDVVKVLCSLVYEQKRLRLWQQLEEVITKEAKRTEQMSMNEQTDLLRRVLNVRTRVLRLERRVNELRGNLEVLCGRSLDLNILDTSLDWFPKVDDSSALENMVSQAEALRPDMAKAYWQACELQSRANRATAEAIPWFSHLEVSYQYADRDQSGGYTGAGDSTEYSDSTRSRVTDYASGLQRSQDSSSSETTWSTEQEIGASSSSRSEDEWRVETAVSIPVFDWLSGQGRDVRKTAKLAWKDVDEAVLDAERELKLRIQTLKSAQQEAEYFDQKILPQAQQLRKQHDSLYKGGQLSPADSVQLAEQLSEIVEEGLATREAVHTSLAALWLACGAPMEIAVTAPPPLFQ